MEKNLFLRVFAALLFSGRSSSLFYLLFFCLCFNKKINAQCGPLINSFPYSEDFETSASWTNGGINSSWAWGTPGHPTISSAGGGLKCWCSGGLTGTSYLGSQQSWIMSPCFDFSTLNYPWISFKLFWECEYIWDGLVFQYSLNGGTTWTNVGAFGDPINCLNDKWFNYNNISNLTASPKHGWCGRIGASVGSCGGGNGSGVWVTAKHCLMGLANQPSVRFRFVFGSGTTCNSYDGIAIDDILIQNAAPNSANFSYTCFNTNSVSFINLSSQCPTSFAWNFGDPGSGISNSSTSQNPAHLFPGPGTYTVSLTASGPCNAPSTTIIPLSILSLTTSTTGQTCNGAGSSTVSVSGGTSAYTYTWIPTGGSASVAAGLPAGIFTISVSDISNCVATHTIFVSQPPSLSAVITQTNISCFGFANGALSATASLGSAPYSYTWLPMGITSQNVNNLNAGTFSLIVRDANNCKTTFNATLGQPAALTLTMITNNVSCYGGNNGQISVICSGGTPGYTYSWTPAIASFSNSTVAGLNQGNYSVTVIDTKNCSLASSIFINQPNTPVNGSILTKTPTCGGANGSATVIASGGNPVYTYFWQPVGLSTSTIFSLTGGTYSVIITDNNGCSKTITTNIMQSTNISINSINVTNPNCPNLNTGSASAIISGGIPPYTYTWFPSQVSGMGLSNIVGLSAGNYSVQIEDINNCLTRGTFPVTSPLPLQLTYNKTDVSCYGAGNGNISLVPNGGTPSYSFSCSSGNIIGSNISNLSSGNFTIVLKDSKNCSLSSTISILQPPVLSAVINHTNILCHGGNNGAVQVIVNGGTPAYSYMWFPVGSNNSILTGLTAGTYSVHIADINNCIVTAQVSLTEPLSQLSGNVSTTSVTCFGGNNGSATVIASGGTPGYTYVWHNFVGSVNYSQNLSAENYSVSIIDLNNCTSTFTFSIVQPSQVTISTNTTLFCKGVPGSLTINVNGGLQPYNYNWNGIFTQSNILTLTLDSTALFNVFAIDSKGCVSNHDIITINIPTALHLISAPNFSVCQGQKALLTANASGGDGNYTFLWQPGFLHGPVQTIVPSSSQIYTVSVADGCLSQKTATVQLDYFLVPSSQITHEGKEGCMPLCISFSNTPLLLSGLVKTYQWNFGSDLASPVHCFNKPGDYLIQLQYTTVDGCIGVETMTDIIRVYPNPVAQFSTDNVYIDAYNPIVNFINKSSGATSFNWFFNNEGNSDEENPSYSFNNTGIQTIVLLSKNEFGCLDTVMKNIEIHPEFTFFAPTSFSPNDDNINDVFLPKGIGWKTDKFDLSIYDQWGQRIFFTKNHEEGWNGKVKGSDRAVQNDSYVWKISMYDIFNKFHEFIGHIIIEK